MNKTYLLVGGASIVSAVAGAAGGYILARKQLEAEYAEFAQKEIAQAKRFYAAVKKSGPFETPESAVKELIGEDKQLDAAVKALTNYQGVPVAKATVAEDGAGLIVKNVWQQPKPSLRDVDENYPHVIDEDEYLANESNHDQISLTWFAGDKVLVDDKDDPIDDDKMQEVVGNTLKAYDSMPEEAHILYVRNNDLKLDFEISRSTGKYVDEVLDVTDD